jgi:CheY-like chemotaxis protein
MVSVAVQTSRSFQAICEMNSSGAQLRAPASQEFRHASAGIFAAVRPSAMYNLPVTPSEALDRVTDPERLFEGFEDLMPFRVQDILLVSSLYDSFILREDGKLNELLIGESLELNLSQVPGVTHVSTGAAALSLARSQPRFNLIVTNLHVGDMDAARLAREVKEAGLDVPVVVLAYDYREIKDFRVRHPATDIERIFLWRGNVRILISIVKYIEDKRNILHDAQLLGVPFLLLVEDNIRYYSSFLPVIYTELIEQSRRVVGEGLNAAHKLLRMRARPKILLCSDYESAAQHVLDYKSYLFGVISDVEFPRDGQLSPEAGFGLASMVRENVPDIPIALQSSRTEFMPRAHACGYSFLRKRSPTLLADLRRFLTDQFAFGDFVFRLPGGGEVGRAGDLNELETMLRKVPGESIAFHGQRNDFSHWLMARTEFALAKKLRPRKVTDFATYENLRNDLLEAIGEYRKEQSELLIGDFKQASFTPTGASFFRIGGGSLGGKARGLAFVRHLLYKHNLARFFPGVRIMVPPTVVLGTDVFDEFLSENDLLDFAVRSSDDAAIQQRFLAAHLPDWLMEDLRAFLAAARYPLAVRSSSLLEDSRYQPFTGVYETLMLPNSHPDLTLRMSPLTEAIKRVYASTFSQHAKAYVQATPYRLEEEKMAVLLQQVVGAPHGGRFYPDFSGVLRSLNFYPVPPMRSEDGIAAVALGLGRTVVNGGNCLRFCPQYPHHPVQFSSVEDVLANSQTEFWAIEADALGNAEHTSPLGQQQDQADAPSGPNSLAGIGEMCFNLKAAEADRTLDRLASTYSPENHAIYDGISRNGIRVVSFAPILKHGVFPLAALLNRLMHIGEDALGRPVEIEFAVRLPQSSDQQADFGFLQMRPLAPSRVGADLHMDTVEPDRLVCQSTMVLGDGQIDDLRDAVVVDYHRFERSQSRSVADAVAYFNAKLGAENKPYLLVGVGRWGSNDPWLGIPVAWDEISGARVIVEAGFRDFHVTPSQGSHFFQNLAAFQVGYFTVNPDAGEGSVDWQWLASQPAVEERDGVRHLHWENPLVVLMSGKSSRGLIFKPSMPVV